MRETLQPTDAPTAALGQDAGRYIYIACPWAPVGGGMFKVADYLIQSQAAGSAVRAAQLRPLDTRGGGSAVFSMWMLLAALAKIARGRLQGKLTGVHVNVAERLSLFRKGTVIAACHALGVPVVLHLHAQMRPFYARLPAALQRLTRWVFSLAACVIVLGPAARRFVVQELQVPADRVEVVVNGVPEPAAPRRGPPADGVHRVLFLGNLSPYKGVADLLQALARPGLPPRLQVSVAGGGDLAGYRAQARGLGVDHLVCFEGWCDQDQVARLLAAAHVLVLPSYDEVLPLVILEALSHGVAVICTPVGEIPSLLTDGVDACFVQPGDIDGIAASLQRILRQPRLLEMLGRNGRALYERRLSLPRFFARIARIHQCYFGVAAEPNPTALPARRSAP